MSYINCDGLSEEYAEERLASEELLSIVCAFFAFQLMVR
jgi:hypothetical protein